MKLRVFNILFFLVTAASFAQTLMVDGVDYNVIATTPNEVAVTGGTSSALDVTKDITHNNSNNAFNVLKYESKHTNNNYKYNS